MLNKDRKRIAALICVIFVVSILLFLPTLSTVLPADTADPETPDSAHGRVLAAVYSLNDTDYMIERKSVDKSAPDEDEDKLRGTTRVENSEQEMSFSDFSQLVTYQHRDLQWRATDVPPELDMKYSAHKDYCRVRNPLDISNLRTRNHTVLNDSATNTTVRYEDAVLREFNIPTRNTTVSLDAGGRIDTVTTRIEFPESSDKTGVNKVLVDSYRNHGNTTVERPSLPLSAEAEIIKRWAVLSGEPAGCT